MQRYLKEKIREDEKKCDNGKEMVRQRIHTKRGFSRSSEKILSNRQAKKIVIKNKEYTRSMRIGIIVRWFVFCMGMVAEEFHHIFKRKL